MGWGMQHIFWTFGEYPSAENLPENRLRGKRVKVRVRKDGEFWIGEVYGTWNILGTKRTGWETVTSQCFTKVGAKIELFNWKRENIPDECQPLLTESGACRKRQVSPKSGNPIATATCLDTASTPQARRSCGGGRPMTGRFSGGLPRQVCISTVTLWL